MTAPGGVDRRRSGGELTTHEALKYSPTMTSPTHPAQETPTASQSVEAARYALLRRLAPSMRHHLVVNLQPIGMIYEVMDRRLCAPQPDLAEVRDNAHKINGFARAALDASLDVVTWLAPEEAATVAAADGVRECLSLLATSLTFRGFSLCNQAGSPPGEVPRSAIRTVLTAALLHTSDAVLPPAELVLSVQPDAKALKLVLTVKPSAGEQGFMTQPPYRRLEWSDVQALAASESVEVTRDGPQRMCLAITLASSASGET